MADQIVMEAEKRVPGKSAVARNLRRAGILPANLNRVGGASESIQFNLHAFERMLQRHASESMIVDLLIEGKACKALLREIQHDPVHGKVLHVDLQEVSMTKTVRVPVQIILVGEAKGVKMGGDQDHLLRELEVDCLVSDMTESVEVDVSHLAIGERIRVEELQVDPKLRVVTPGDVVVVSVNAPRVEELPGAAGAAGEGAEPAVVGDAGSDQKESDGSPASGES